MRWYGVRHHAGVVDQQVDRAEAGAASAAARRTDVEVGEVDAPAARARPPGTSRADGVARSRRAARALRPASTTRAPRRASSSAVWWPSPPTVVPVTSAVRPDWSGMSAGRQACGAGRGHGVVARLASDPLRRAPASPLDRDAAAARRSRRPPASRMNVSRSIASAHRRLGRRLGAAARRGPRRRPRTRTARCPPTSSTTVVPAGAADPLGEHAARGSRRGSRPCAGPAARVHAAGAADRAADVLLVHPHVERPVAQQRAPSPRDAAEDPLGLRAAPSVGGSASSAVCRAVAASRISLISSSGRAVAAGDHALLGVEAHQPGHVRAARRPRRSPRARRRGSPRGARCARRTPCTSQPGQVGGRGPLLGAAAARAAR